ncbi:hypothetical protein THOD04_130061 [Vibrio owensii]|nr:hypothetical protein THOD04_130061 [Vibrio owensii]
MIATELDEFANSGALLGSGTLADKKIESLKFIPPILQAPSLHA